MTEAHIPNKTNFQPYCGYHQNWKGGSIDELTQTGPGTICGEYLRRYWHPIFLTTELGDKPRLIKILSEELVLFRDKGGHYGLVHKNCPHRRASLEYGKCVDHGIQCCYHGWVFDVDGTVLEIPSEPQESISAINVRTSIRLGAYPVKEFKGLLFAYFGPQEERPEFPLYDTFDIDGMIMTPYAAPFKCNWIQVLDAIVDPVHTAFLHQSQFSDGFGVLGEIEFYHRQKIRFLGTATRRVGENAWVRVNELILPNFTQSGSAFAVDGTQEKHFGRSAFTRWVVPIDDENCIAFAWGNFGERGDPLELNTVEGMQLIEQGELIDRTYEEKQSSPGDVEAVEGMGSISDHEKENLVSGGDRGVAIYRAQMRILCRSLQKGKLPPQPTELAEGTIPTYGSDTVIRIFSETDKTEESALLKKTNDQVMEILFDGDEKEGNARDQYIFHRLEKISQSEA